MSYTSLAYHIAFSTKERRPMLSSDILPRLCRYIGGIVCQVGGHLLAVNGTHDHLHLLTVFGPTVQLADCVRTIKTNSSKWIHQRFPQAAAFAWQDGYAAFSVSRSMLSQVQKYVENQPAHHREMSFGEELISLLERHGIEYDKRYLSA